jgi:hypothetical protein
MKGIAFLLCGVLCGGLTSCGAFKKEEPEQLDPYRSIASDQINAVLYTNKPPEKILKKLAGIGVTKGRLFGEFKTTTGIDDWFGDNLGDGRVRYTSLTCGLSPVVDEGGLITAFYRNKKFYDGKMYPELALSPELQAQE